MPENKLQVHSDEYNVDGDFWLAADGCYRVEVIVGGKRYTRTLDKENIVPERYVPDYAWMKLDDLYSDILLGIAEEVGYDI